MAAEAGGRRGSGSVQARKPHLLLGLTGSVAAIKAEALVEALGAWAEVRLVHTESAARFLATDLAVLLAAKCEVFSDDDEWECLEKRGVPLHVELRDWADVFVIAPLSANSLAKLATGICDNLVTCVARAWDMQDRALVVCPAMNTKMWDHPVTDHHLSTLRGWGVCVVPPIEKLLACGELGVGAMEEVVAISNQVQDIMRHFA